MWLRQSYLELAHCAFHGNIKLIAMPLRHAAVCFQLQVVSLPLHLGVSTGASQGCVKSAIGTREGPVRGRNEIAEAISSPAAVDHL